MKDGWIKAERGGIKQFFREVDRGQRTTNSFWFSLRTAMIAHSRLIQFNSTSLEGFSSPKK